MAMFVEGLDNCSEPERYFLRTVLRMKKFEYVLWED